MSTTWLRVGGGLAAFALIAIAGLGLLGGLEFEEAIDTFAVVMVVAIPAGIIAYALVEYAWTGLGSSFGPPLLLALYWRRTTRWGALAGMVTGTVGTVVSTNALELGIDIGALDASVLVGYPGSLISSWQRIGRVGRRGREGLGSLTWRREDATSCT